MSTPPFDVLSADAAPWTEAIAAFADAVRHGLTKPQRELPPCYLYDEVGSALYEAITLLPEYGLSRADERLLFRHADSILNFLPDRLIVTELGSCSARKTRWLLQALVNRAAPLLYIPIDLPASRPKSSFRQFFNVGGLSLIGLERSYLEGLHTGDFVSSHFYHDVRYDEAQRRIEMHLRSNRRQPGHIENVGLTCDFRSDEIIWTESRHKFNLMNCVPWPPRAGFTA